MTTPRDLLKQALQSKTAAAAPRARRPRALPTPTPSPLSSPELRGLGSGKGQGAPAPRGGWPVNNGPDVPSHPGNPSSNAGGGVKTAAMKIARSIPGRLDGDETLDKLAAMGRKKKKKRSC